MKLTLLNLVCFSSSLRPSSLRRLAVAALALGCALAASADQVTLRNGKVVEGVIVQQNDETLLVRTNAGTLKINRAEVAGVAQTDRIAEEISGDNAFARRQYSEAIRIYNLGLAKVPANSAAAARLRTRLQQVAQARLQGATQAVLGSIQQAQAAKREGRLDEAQRLLDQVMPQLPAGEDITSNVAALLADVHFQRALIARNQMNTIEEERELAEAVKAYEPFYQAHLRIGDLRLGSSATMQAGLEGIRRGLEYGEGQMPDEERVRYYYKIAEKYFEQGDYENAAANFAEVIRSKNVSSAYADALDRAVQSYIKLSERTTDVDYGKTIRNLNQALSLNAENKSALFLLGSIYRNTGQTSISVTALEKLVAVDDKYPKAHLVLAQAYLDQSDYINARRHLDSELVNDPTSYDALTYRGEVRTQLGDFDGAKQDLDKAVNLFPESYRAYLLSAQLAYTQKRYDDMIKFLERTLKIKQDSLEARIEMGRVLQAQEKFTDAEKWYGQVVDVLTGTSSTLPFRLRNILADAQTNLGLLNFAQNQPRQAEEKYLAALKAVDNYAPAYMRIGDVKRKLADDVNERPAKMRLYAEAKSFYERAIEAAPANPDNYLNLAILLHRYVKTPLAAIPFYQAYLDKGGRQKSEVEQAIAECRTGNTGDTKETTGTARGAGSTTGTLTTGAGATTQTASARLDDAATSAATTAVSSAGQKL